ncbi:transposase [Streptomyces sp. GMY02]|nr:transposase [Streptomyces sp. GMY02]
MRMALGRHVPGGLRGSRGDRGVRIPRRPVPVRGLADEAHRAALRYHRPGGADRRDRDVAADARRSRHLAPARRRRPGPALVDHAHTRQLQRRHHVRQSPGGYSRPQARQGPTPDRPDRVLADKAYSSRSIRQLLRRRGIAATIPERRDQIANHKRRGAHGGGRPAFGKTAYRDRNVVE